VKPFRTEFGFYLGTAASFVRLGLSSTSTTGTWRVARPLSKCRVVIGPPDQESDPSCNISGREFTRNITSDNKVSKATFVHVLSFNISVSSILVTRIMLSAAPLQCWPPTGTRFHSDFCPAASLFFL
jgi:hypothetical protein